MIAGRVLDPASLIVAGAFVTATAGNGGSVHTRTNTDGLTCWRRLSSAGIRSQSKCVDSSELSASPSREAAHAATTLIRPAFRERGFRRITISTSWSSAVNRFIRRSTE
jgi:hypothetical protein